MKCAVGNANLGTWCRAIHSLTSLGDDEIHLDFSDDIFTLYTCNLSQTTFATFLFFKPFFDSYVMTSDEPEKVSLPGKIILKPYKTQKVAKSYLSSTINYTPDEDYITITSEGKSHILTTYRLGASANSEEMLFDSDPYSRPNCLKADAKVLSNCLSNFGHVKGLTDINLKIKDQKVTLRNIVTDVARKEGSVVTEYNLTSFDFIDYEIPNSFAIDLTFGFREFKIFTTLAEQLKLPISIHFQTPLEPVIIVVKTDLFEGRLCMATKLPEVDPFAFANTPQNGSEPLCSGTNGGISNVTSQASSVASGSRARSMTQEMNRRHVNTVSLENEISEGAQRPSKRLRRTESPPTQLTSFNERVETTNPPVPPPPVINITQEVERMAARNKSNAYKSLQRLMNTPRMTEEEYLKTIPGHDIVICPDSDEEN